ncbi:MAG: hypothetical protein RMJ16_12845 [Thermoguttaceae bacterium]|nr:hypothetical protein [Thermoguttaceae bacterium]
MPRLRSLQDPRPEAPFEGGQGTLGGLRAGWIMRLYRALVGFSLVLACYWLYTLIIVPIIEPPGVQVRSQGLSPQEVVQAEERFQRYRRRLLPLFPEGTWHLGKTKIIETEDVIVLLEEHARIDDFHLRVWPCAGILAATVDEETQAIRSALVIEAPQGALLEFDAPVDLRLGQIRQPRRVVVHGPVRLRQYNRDLPTEQLLTVETEDVEVNAERIATDGEVRFRLGPHFGKGRGLTVRFGSGTPGGKEHPGDRAPRTVDEISVASVERLHLAFPPGKRGGKDSGGRLPETIAFELACDGPFRFDPASCRATFEGNVRGWRSGPGAQDELRCQELILWLAGDTSFLKQNGLLRGEKGDEAAQPGSPLSLPAERANAGVIGASAGERPASAGFASKDGEQLVGQLGSWEVRRVQIRGGPAVVRAPSWQFSFEGNFLDYELATGQYFLGAEERTTVRYGGVRIVATKLRGKLPFEALGTGWNEVEAELTGPGSLSHTFADRSDPQILAEWQGQLFIRPHEGYQVVSLIGGAEINASALGSLRAEEVHIWLLPPGREEDSPRSAPAADPLQSLPVPEPARRNESTPPETVVQIGGLRPDRLLAQKNVVLLSPQAHATTQELRVLFEQESDPRRVSGGMPARSGFAQPFEGWRGAGQGLTQTEIGRKGFSGICPPMPTGYLTGDFVHRKAAGWTGMLPLVNAWGDKAPLGKVVVLTSADGLSFANGAIRPASPGSVDKLGWPGGAMVSGGAEREGLSGSSVGPTSGVVPVEISAGAIHLRVRVGPKGLECAEAFLDQSVQLVEKRGPPTGDPRDKPALLTGQRVYVADPATPYWSVLVEGQPGHVEARGLGLTAPRIAVNAASNRVWVDQPGRLELWLRPQEAGWNSPSESLPLVVQWGGSFVFDGQVARFDGSVQARAHEADLVTGELEVCLREPVVFGNFSSSVRPQPERLICGGGTVLSRRRPEGPQEGGSGPPPRDFLEVSGLQLEWASGEFAARGPGRLVASPNPEGSLVAPQNEPAGTFAPNSPSDERAAITIPSQQAGMPTGILSVRFADRLEGNLWQRRARMLGHVRGIYVRHWPWEWIPDPDEPTDPPAGSVRFSCGAITAVELSPPGAGRSWELVAEDNVRLEGQGFVARAPRACFVQGKELLVLEGGPRTPAELYRQERPGEPAAGHSATRILYWLGSKRLVAEGLQTLQVP